MAARACLEHPIARFLLDAVGGFVLILNSHRQVLAVNAAVEAWVGGCEPAIQGRRPGEIFSCVHASEGPAGCGTSQACAYCGAVRAILECQTTGRTAHGECLMTLCRQGRLEAAEFLVTASPMEVGPHHFIAIILQDRSAQKRREALERLFFHDVANLLQGIRGWSDLLVEGGHTARLAAEKLVRLTDLLERELRSHRDMARAESGHLHPNLSVVRPSDLMREVMDLLDRHPRALGRRLELTVEADPLLTTDPQLLSRVLINMGVNAMEAIPEGGIVRFATRWAGDRVRLEVRNPGEVPAAVRTRIFQRSFSTKGEQGRGLGTYAMKLFGEEVLGGRVGFECGRGETVFHIELPEQGPWPGA